YALLLPLLLEDVAAVARRHVAVGALRAAARRTISVIRVTADEPPLTRRAIAIMPLAGRPHDGGRATDARVGIAPRGGAAEVLGPDASARCRQIQRGLGPG